MNIHIIQHELFESTGAIATWVDQRKHQARITKVYAGDPLPKNTDDFDFLIVMGGPQSPATTKTECPHFDGQGEINLIKEAIANNKRVLGVCLGAQLLGEAYDARFEHSPQREIGVLPITLTDAAMRDPFFSTVSKTFAVGHWHGDMPGLSKNAVILAVSMGCPRQVIRYSDRVYGFQCHFEFDAQTVELMLAHCAEDLENPKALPYIQTESQLKNADYSQMNQILFDFLDFMVAKEE